MELTLLAGVEALGFTQKAIKAVHAVKVVEGRCLPGLRETSLDLLSESRETGLMQNEVIHGLGEGHRTGMNNSERHDDKEIMCHEVGVGVTVVVT